MITAVYFEDDDGRKVVVAAFLMQYDAKVFIEAQRDFKKLKERSFAAMEMKDLTLDAWRGWGVIMGQTNKAGSSSLRSAAEGKNDE